MATPSRALPDDPGTLRLGTLVLVDAGAREETFGVTPTGSLQPGVAHAVELSGPDDLKVVVSDTAWANGERDVRAVETSGPPQIQSLHDRLRLSIRGVDTGLSVCDLRQARVKLNTEPMWSSLYQADRGAHLLGTGTDIVSLIEDHDALVGTRQSVLDDASPRRNGLCALFPERDALVPLIAYVVTRVIPVLNMVFVPASAVFADYKPPDRARHETERRVYVVLLSAEAGRSPDPSLPPVYVGQTGKPRADRFREHLIGYKSSGVVRHHGMRLMPELYPQADRITSSDQAGELEAWWAGQLRARGHLVHGGH